MTSKKKSAQNSELAFDGNDKTEIYVVGAENPGAQAKCPTLKKKFSTRLEIYEFTSRDIAQTCLVLQLP